LTDGVNQTVNSEYVTMSWQITFLC